MVFDWKALRTGLVDYLGDLPLCYEGLSKDTRVKLAFYYPHYFNNSDEYPFLETILKIFVDKHNEVYNTVVFYPGCERNDFGVPVMSFNDYVQNNPLAYQEILNWGRANHLDPLAMTERYLQICRHAGIKPLSSAQSLILQLDNLLKKPLLNRFEFHTIHLPFSIDETLLNTLISELEKINTGMSLLVCGLLLEGKIESFADSDEPAYIEKRLHDAVSFYLKTALEDSSPAALMAQFILWEMKTTTANGSIKERLSRYNIHPPLSYVPKYQEFPLDNSSMVKALLYPSLRFFPLPLRLPIPENSSTREFKPT